ncbi:hypothetical protein Emed_005553 [Eimeria media]
MARGDAEALVRPPPKHSKCYKNKQKLMPIKQTLMDLRKEKEKASHWLSHGDNVLNCVGLILVPNESDHQHASTTELNAPLDALGEAASPNPDEDTVGKWRRGTHRTLGVVDAGAANHMSPC